MDVGSPLHLSSPDVSLVLDLTEPGLPTIAHWGAPLGGIAADDLVALCRAVRAPLAGSGPDQAFPLTLPPQAGLAYFGIPGLRGHREGYDSAPVFGDVTADVGPGSVSLRSSAAAHGLELRTDLELGPTGMLR